MNKKQGLIIALLMGSAIAVQAQTWDGGADDGTAANARWNIAGNWVGDAEPTYGNTADIVFHTSGAGNLTSYIGQDRIMRSLSFNNNVTNALGIVTENHLGATRAFTFEANSGNASITVDSGATAGITISGGGDMVLSSALDVTHNGSGLLTLGAVISSTATNDVTFAGTGTTKLNAVNTFTGDVNLNGGTVQFDAQNRFGDSANKLFFDGGTIQLVDATAARAVSREVNIASGGATVDVDTSQILTFSGLLKGTGDLTVTGLGDGTARVRLSDTENLNNWTGNLNIQDGGQVDFDDRNALGTLNKTITLNDGTLRNISTDTQNLHGNTTISIGANGGALQASHRDGGLVVRGDITGTGLLTTGGNGTIDLTVSTNSWTGGIKIAGGTTKISEVLQLGTGDVELNGGKLEWDGSALGELSQQVTIGSGGGTIQANSQRLRLQDYTGSGDITVTGSGEVQANDGTTDFSGAWNITNAGTLVATTGAEGSNAMLGSGDVNMDNGTLAFLVGGSDTHTRDTVLGAGGGTFELGGTDSQNPTITWNGNISGAGALTVANNGGTSGGLILGGANTFNGDAIVNSGSSLTLVDGGSMTFYIGADGVNNGLLGDGTVSLNGGFVFDLTSASTTVGDSWTIVDHDALTESYGATFAVTDFTNNSGVWTSGNYEFDQSSGVLTVIPEPATLGLMGVIFAGILFWRRLLA